MKQTTVTELLKKRAKNMQNQSELYQVNDDLVVQIEYMPLPALIELQDQYPDAETNKAQGFHLTKEMVYLSCPIFRSQGLFDGAETDFHEPHNILDEVLTINELSKLAEHISKHYEGGIDLKKK